MQSRTSIRGRFNPAALHNPALSNSEALRGDNIGALQLALGSLAPGATVRIAVLLGQTASVEAALPTIRQYRDPGQRQLAPRRAGLGLVDQPGDRRSALKEDGRPAGLSTATS